jgi:phage baseplate assembly protein W
MKRTPEEKLLNPRPGSKIAEARDYGIDLTQLVENLRLTPAQRIKKNDDAVNSILKFEEAMRRAKSKAKSKADV